MADREKASVASKNAPEGLGKRRTTAADKRVAPLKRELVNAKASHPRLVEAGTCSEADANEARTDLQNLQARLVEVGQGAKMALKAPNNIRAQTAKSANVAEKASRQPKEGSARA